MKSRQVSSTLLVAVFGLIGSLVAAIPAAQATDSAKVLDPNTDRAGSAVGVIVKTTATRQVLGSDIVTAVDEALPVDVGVSQVRGEGAEVSMVGFDEPVDASTVADVVEALQDRPDVEWAIPNARLQARSVSPVTPDDPKFAAQLNLWDAGSTASAGGFSVKAPALWPITRGTANTVVAVLDSGIVAAHPDLKNKLVPGYDFVDDECIVVNSNCVRAKTFISAGDGNGIDADPSDPGDWVDATYATRCDLDAGTRRASSWHGSHVAGIIAAEADNGRGIAGVAPGVKVQPVRVLGHCGGVTWDLFVGMIWAAGLNLQQEMDDSFYAKVPTNTQPVKVLNVSLGGQAESVSERNNLCRAYSYYASRVRAQGIVLVAAAGNDSDSRLANADLSYPASCDGFISVGATSRTGHRAWYSQAGPSVDISAPGGDVEVEGPSDTIWSTILNSSKSPNSNFVEAGSEGTSMAVPEVSGGAALLYSLGMTDPAAVEAALKATAQPFPAPEASYQSRHVTFNGRTFATAQLNCNPSLCGAGILDLSKIATTALPTGRATISGRLVRGSTITLTGSTWIHASGTPIRTWYRGGAVVGQGGSYTVTAADVGQLISVREWAPGGSNSSIFASAAVTIPKQKVTVKRALPAKIKASKRAKLVVRVASPGIVPTGKLRVYDGKKRIAEKRLSAGNRGKVTIKLRKLKRGKHTIKVVYSGNGALQSGTSKVKKVTSK